MKSNIQLDTRANSVRTFLRYAALFTLTLISLTTVAQVGVGTITPDASAQFEVASPNKGILIPRLTEAGRSSIGAPANGLLIYQTDNNPGFYYFNGMQWVPIAGPGSSAPMVGFSATGFGDTQSGSGNVSASWSTRYVEGGSFDFSDGIYTVPQSGLYKVSAKLNFAQPAAATISLGSGVNPNIQFRVNGTEYGRSLFPILNVNVALVLTLRAMINTGTIIFDDVVQLNTGDQLSLYYDNSGYTAAINLGTSGEGISWTVMRIGDAPVTPP